MRCARFIERGLSDRTLSVSRKNILITITHMCWHCMISMCISFRNVLVITIVNYVCLPACLPAWLAVFSLANLLNELSRLMNFRERKKHTYCSLSTEEFSVCLFALCLRDCFTQAVELYSIQISWLRPFYFFFFLLFLFRKTINNSMMGKNGVNFKNRSVCVKSFTHACGFFMMTL